MPQWTRPRARHSRGADVNVAARKRCRNARLTILLRLQEDRAALVGAEEVAIANVQVLQERALGFGRAQAGQEDSIRRIRSGIGSDNVVLVLGRFRVCRAYFTNCLKNASSRLILSSLNFWYSGTSSRRLCFSD